MDKKPFDKQAELLRRMQKVIHEFLELGYSKDDFEVKAPSDTVGYVYFNNKFFYSAHRDTFAYVKDNIIYYIDKSIPLSDLIILYG